MTDFLLIKHLQAKYPLNVQILKIKRRPQKSFSIVFLPENIITSPAHTQRHYIQDKKSRMLNNSV